MALLTREQILAAHDLPVKELEVPAWGGTIRIKKLGALSAQAFSESVEKDNTARAMVALCALSIVGDDGRPLFEIADVEELGHRSADALRYVFDACVELNGMTQEAD